MTDGVIEKPNYGLQDPQPLQEDDPLRIRRREELVGHYKRVGTDIKEGVLPIEQFANEQTERDLANEAQAEYDPLTGLLNRRGFFNALDEALLAFRRILHTSGVQGKTDTALGCLVLLDLDDFGQLNKTKGDDFGDKTLQLVAIALTGAVRPGDLVARFGGEEFLIYLPGAKLEDAAHVIDIRVRENIPKTTAENLDGFRQMGSFGIAQLPGNLTEEDLLKPSTRTDLFNTAYRNAVAAKVFAKEEGKNRTAIHRPDGTLQITTPPSTQPT